MVRLRFVTILLGVGCAVEAPVPCSDGPHFPDLDGDLFGDDAGATYACDAPEEWVEVGGDCNDGDATVKPGAAETCDGLDQDCDLLVDEAAIDAPSWHPDADGDEHGDQSASVAQCSAPAGYLADASDCDDTNSAIHPGAEEYCDEVDSDCDGDDDDPESVGATLWHPDRDHDGFGDLSSGNRSCSAHPGEVVDGSDCDDTDPDIHPGAEEQCDGTDHDCDGAINEFGSVDALPWYLDADTDGFGDSTAAVFACERPASYVPNDDDCDDTDEEIHPFAQEACDGDDHDCDGQVLEPSSIDALPWYADADADGSGDANVAVIACERPDGYVDVACDCDDSDAEYGPDGLPCVPTTCTAGEVVFDDGCGRTDLTTAFADAATSLVTYTVSDPGVLSFCDGTSFVSLIIDASPVTIRGVDGVGSTVLDAAGGPLLTLEPGAGELTIEGLTLQNAAGPGGLVGGDAADVTVISSALSDSTLEEASGAILDIVGDLSVYDSSITGLSFSYTSFAAVSCTGGLIRATGDVSLDASTVEGNSVSCGSIGDPSSIGESDLAVFQVGGSLVAVDSLMNGNEASIKVDGAGAYAYASSVGAIGADLDLENTIVSSNVSSVNLVCRATVCERYGYGGAFWVGGDVTMTDSLFQENQAMTSGYDVWRPDQVDVELVVGGALFLEQGSLTCTSTGGTHGFLANSGEDGGGAIWWTATSSLEVLSSSGCDWGEDGTGDDNIGGDIGGAVTVSQGDDATFTCVATTGCGT